ncbi:YncE family protein [Corynebacterium sp. H130]|uniref:YncE family protein n=1 Tax=Corynebacterium sp. H130 TaxID=3133444 RepID=UPI0030AC4FAC
MKNSLRRSVVALLAASTCALASCTPPNVQDPQKQAEQQAGSGQTVSGALGNATPAASPAADNPAGEVLKLEGPLSKAKDVELAGDVLAVRSGDTLAIGTVDKFRTNSAEHIEINSRCGDLTVTGDTFVLPCPVPILGGAGGGVIYLIDAKNPKLDNTRRADVPFTSAALTSTGEVIGGSSEQPDVHVFRGTDSSNVKKIATSRKAHQIVASAVDGTRDGVVFIDREKTVIQGVDFKENRPGGALRMGVGVGSIAAGENGLFLAADALGHQLGVYTDDDILMLHQTIATEKSPWAVAWDPHRKLAWIASNETNRIQAFRLSSGVPELQGSVSSVANVRSMTIDADGTIYALSDSGDGLQVIKSQDLKLD